MKKLAILALIGLVVSAQAATIKWGIGGKLYGVDGEGNTTQVYADGVGWYDDAKAGSFVLVYLGVNAEAKTASSITDAMVVENSAVSVADTIATTGRANQIGNANKTFSIDVADVAGATYQVFFLLDGKYSDLYTSAAMTTAAQNTVKVTYDGMAYSTTPSPLYAAGTSTAASYVSVPEPATAAFALLGFGMLLKRRKA